MKKPKKEIKALYTSVVGCGTVFREISAQPPLLSINHLFLLDFSLQNPPGFINLVELPAKIAVQQISLLEN
jgi:hypothetical protein